MPTNVICIHFRDSRCMHTAAPRHIIWNHPSCILWEQKDARITECALREAPTRPRHLVIPPPKKS